MPSPPAFRCSKRGLSSLFGWRASRSKSDRKRIETALAIRHANFEATGCKNKKARKLLSLRALCPGQDLNLHALRRYHLKVVRLPISPPGRCGDDYIVGQARVEMKEILRWDLAPGHRVFIKKPQTHGSGVDIQMLFGFLHNQRRVMPAEAEAVAHGVGDLVVAGFVRDVVQIAFGIGVVQVDGGGDEIVVNGQ